jgi:hypothetical protein
MASSGPSPQALEELQRISNYRFVRRTMRVGVIVHLMLGLLCLLCATGVPACVRALFAGAAIFFLIRGGAALAWPSPTLMLFDVCAWLAASVWSISLAIGGAGTVYHAGAAGFGMALHYYRRYVRLRRIAVQEPSPELTRRIDEIVKQISKCDPAADRDIIEFVDDGSTYAAALGWPLQWKGRLAPDQAIFVDDSGKCVLFGKRNDVTFTPREVVRAKRWTAGRFLIGSQELRAAMSPESLRRYQEWKEGVMTPAADGGPAM